MTIHDENEEEDGVLYEGDIIRTEILIHFDVLGLLLYKIDRYAVIVCSGVRERSVVKNADGTKFVLCVPRFEEPPGRTNALSSTRRETQSVIDGFCFF